MTYFMSKCISTCWRINLYGSKRLVNITYLYECSTIYIASIEGVVAVNQ